MYAHTHTIVLIIAIGISEGCMQRWRVRLMRLVVQLIDPDPTAHPASKLALPADAVRKAKKSE